MENERKRGFVIFRCSAAEKSHIHGWAAAKGCTAADLARTALEPFLSVPAPTVTPTQAPQPAPASKG